MDQTPRYDYVLIGAGIMSATYGVLLKLLNPDLKIALVERLDSPALESSDVWNNAGTGHAALCELNYMPDSKDGSIPSADKAIDINEQFVTSRQFWSYLVEIGVLGDPKTFINSVPHMTFVRGAKDVDYLRRRFRSLKDQPLFEGMEYSEDFTQIEKWTPLLIDGRGDEVVAATKIDSGTDVDYGEMTRQMVSWLTENGVEMITNTDIIRLRKLVDGGWELKSMNRDHRYLAANKVFVGAGGYALKLLQSSGISEARGYGTFPVSGHFLRTDNPEVVKKHWAKVYSQAAVGAPPMSVPHLDTRIVDGKPSLLFGPFAGFNPKFLKNGSALDLPFSVRMANLLPYLSVAVTNLGLLKYLISEILKSKKKKLDGLKEFVPNAKDEDWTLYEAGQRAQVIAPKGRVGTLQFGTQVISSADKTISGLLGASPGASVSAKVMLDVLEQLEPSMLTENHEKIRKMIPTFKRPINSDKKLSEQTLKKTASVLKLTK
jgi:malate dehydrogenase (quinone)